MPNTGPALQITPAWLHEMAAWVREVALSLLGWGAIDLPGQASPRHRLNRQRLQVRWFHTGALGSLDRLLSGGSGFDLCHLGFLVQLGLISSWCIRIASSSCFGPASSASYYHGRAAAAAVSASISLGAWRILVRRS